MKSSRALSQLTLVASDMAYGAPNFQILTTLRPYDDTEPAFSPGFSYDQQFQVVHQGADPGSGFKYLILKNSANADLIVSFAGTDGINHHDWAANSLALGWSQWERNRNSVLARIDQLASPGAAIHFTGQSLGGALAEYAAYQWIKNANVGIDGIQKQRAEQARTTLTTFNGLGSEQGISDNLHGRGPIDQSLLGGFSQSAAYWIRNDLVTRLGEGHSGVPVYKLDHTSLNIKPEFLQIRDSQHWDLGPVDAHRIEFGFYPRLSQSNNFDKFQTFTSGQFEALEIAAAETQRMSRMAAAIFNGKFKNETEAAATMAAGLIGGALLVMLQKLQTSRKK